MDPRKTIKILAVISLIFGIIGLIFSGLAIIGGGAFTAMSGNQQIVSELESDPELADSINQLNQAAGTDLDAQGAAAATGVLVLVIGIVGIISSVFSILEAVFGFKAAGGKGAKPAFIIGIIAVVFAVVSLILNGASGIISSAISIAVSGLYTYCAKQIMDEESGAEA